MGFAQSIARGMGMTRSPETSTADTDFRDWTSYYAPTAAGVVVNQASSMHVSAVYACVTILSYDLAKLGATLFRGERKGARTAASDHYLARLLRKPAPWLTWMEFAAMLQASVLLNGNGYAVIVRDPFTGRPQMLVPINPERVHLYQGPDAQLFFMVGRSGMHEMAVLRDQPLLIPYEDMFHIKALTLNGLLGLSQISTAREAFGLAIAQEQLASRWAGNSAKPSGILSTEQKLDPVVAERCKQNWKEANSGLFNSGKTAVLESGLKWQPLSMNSEELQFIEARKFQLSEIARIFRVPLYKLGERVSGASVSQLAQEYLNDSLSSWIKMWYARLDFTFDLAESVLFVEFDVDSLIEADMATRYAAHKSALGGMPWKNINDVRRSEGMQDEEGGDILYRPAAMVPITSPVTGSDGSGGKLGSDLTGEGGEGGGRPSEGLELDDNEVAQASGTTQGSGPAKTAEGYQVLRTKADTYGVAVRAGVITPQTVDEEAFRKSLNLPPMSPEAQKSWTDDKGVRRPITITPPHGSAPKPGFGGGAPAPADEDSEKPDDET